MITTADLLDLGFAHVRTTAYDAIFEGHNLRVTLRTGKKQGIYIIRIGQSCPLFHTDFYLREQMEAMLFALTRVGQA